MVSSVDDINISQANQQRLRWSRTPIWNSNGKQPADHDTQLIYRTKDKQPVPSSRYTGSPHYNTSLMFSSFSSCLRPLPQFSASTDTVESESSKQHMSTSRFPHHKSWIAGWLWGSKKQRLAYEEVTGYVFVNCQIGAPNMQDMRANEYMLHQTRWNNKSKHSANAAILFLQNRVKIWHHRTSAPVFYSNIFFPQRIFKRQLHMKCVLSSDGKLHMNK